MDKLGFSFGSVDINWFIITIWTYFLHRESLWGLVQCFTPKEGLLWHVCASVRNLWQKKTKQKVTRQQISINQRTSYELRHFDSKYTYIDVRMLDTFSYKMIFFASLNIRNFEFLFQFSDISVDWIVIQFNLYSKRSLYGTMFRVHQINSMKIASTNLFFPKINVLFSSCIFSS